jgi:hypothetical protein
MAQRFLYKDFVQTLSERFEANLTYISYIYGFDAGREFEVAVCKTLRSALPQRFGICRGHVVNAKGDQAGDDIIIYDRQLFPTLRLLADEDYSLKEWIPIEAVYAYIEAKHTIDLEQIEAKAGDDSSLSHALSQAAKVKTLCNSRERIPPERITRSFSMAPGSVGSPEGLPPYKNPIYTMVMSRFVRFGKDKITDPAEIGKRLIGYRLGVSEQPDAVVLGTSNLMLPEIERKDGWKKMLFFEPGCVQCAYETPKTAYGIALCSLLNALDFIQLGTLPWSDILNDAFGIKK